MSSALDQGRSQRIQTATNKIRSHGAELELYWVSGHEGIKSNEMADKVAEIAHSLPLPPPVRLHHEVAARVSLIWALSWKSWDKRWSEGTKEAQYRKLAPKVNYCQLNIHAGRPKAHSALMVQLRTDKIGFNQFLHERRVPGVLTAHCPCGEGHMSVKHEKEEEQGIWRFR